MNLSSLSNEDLDLILSAVMVSTDESANLVAGAVLKEQYDRKTKSNETRKKFKI